jgi:hypothetical protein
MAADITQASENPLQIDSGRYIMSAIGQDRPLAELPVQGLESVRGALLCVLKK